MTLVNGTDKEPTGAQNGFTPHTEQNSDVEVVEEMHVTDDALIYGVTDNPPIHLTVLFAFQVRLIPLKYICFCCCCVNFV